MLFSNAPVRPPVANSKFGDYVVESETARLNAGVLKSNIQQSSASTLKVRPNVHEYKESSMSLEEVFTRVGHKAFIVAHKMSNYVGAATGAICLASFVRGDVFNAGIAAGYTAILLMMSYGSKEVLVALKSDIEKMDSEKQNPREGEAQY